MPNILHITAHMGGGVGKAIEGTARYNLENRTGFTHRVLMLEEPERPKYAEACRQNGIGVSVAGNDEEIAQAVRWADLVVLNWWNHPAMAAFLHRFPQIPIRLVLWSHVNGCTYPMLPFGLVRMVHKAFFTTRYTFDNPYWTPEERTFVREHAAAVYGVGELNLPEAPPRPHEGFCIGYVGTLSYSKLNPDFARYCAAVDVPDAVFSLVGDASGRARLDRDAAESSLSAPLRYTGFTPDVAACLAGFDVFGYLLNPWHFGATENALLEAMAAGLPVVALDQCAEKYIVTNGETGLLVHTPAEYGQAVHFLYEHPQERRRLGERARRHVLEEFSMARNAARMNAAFEEVLRLPPRVFSFGALFGSTPHEWFLSCLGADRECFASLPRAHNEPEREAAAAGIAACRPVFREKSKSSVYQFARCFPGDPVLAQWKKVLEETEDAKPM